MRIHNTKELRLRATSHVREDHVKQGTYGEGKTNGHAEFKACAIGCLSTPHRIADLKEFLKVWTDEFSVCDTALRISDHQQRKLLSEEFGICLELSKLAEGFFEALPFHGGAINFVKEFAEALVEGSEIVPSEVREWTRRNLGFEPDLEYNRPDESWYDEVQIAIVELSGECPDDPGNSYGDLATDLKDRFLTWLRTRKPVTA